MRSNPMVVSWYGNDLLQLRNSFKSFRRNSNPIDHLTRGYGRARVAHYDMSTRRVKSIRGDDEIRSEALSIFS